MTFSLSLKTVPSELKKAFLPDLQKSLGSWEGMKIIAIGPKGGKIVGYGKGLKPIYAGSPEAKKLAAQKASAAAKKPGEAFDASHDEAALHWLQHLGIVALQATTGAVAVDAEAAKHLTDAFGVSGKPLGGGAVGFKTSDLWMHVGDPFVPFDDEKVATLAALAAGAAGDDAPWSAKKLQKLKMGPGAGGSHGAKFVLDDKGNKVGVWKEASGYNVPPAYAEEAYARVAKLVFPKPSLYPQGMVVEWSGKKGCLLTHIDNTGVLGSEMSGGKHGVSQASIQKHFLRLVQHQVLDWLLANHDSHGGNFVLTPDGDVAAVDKGQSFKFIGQDELSASYSPNPSNPVYNQLWSEFQKGKVTVSKDEILKAVGEVLGGISKLSVEQYQQILAPYLEVSGGAKKWGAIKKRFQNIQSDWESFLAQMFKAPSVSIPLPIPDAAPAMTAVEATEPAKTAAPKQLKTEKQYKDAPVGTKVVSGAYGWTKIGPDLWDAGDGEAHSSAMMTSGPPADVVAEFGPEHTEGAAKKPAAAPVPAPVAAPAPAPVPKPTEALKMPGWPMKKGNVTVHHPGNPPTSMWPAKYPGPGFTAEVDYKPKSGPGGVYKFVFEEKNGKPFVNVFDASGKKILEGGSIQEAADIPTLIAKGLPLSMSSTEKKKNSIGYSATKLFQLDAFKDDFSASASTSGTSSPASMDVKELEQKKIVTPETKKLTLHDVLQSVPDGVLTDATVIPFQVGDHLKAYSVKDVDPLAKWPATVPPLGVFWKKQHSSGDVHFAVGTVGYDGVPASLTYKLKADGSVVTATGVLPEVALALANDPEVQKAIVEFQKTIDAEADAVLVGPAPAATAPSGTASPWTPLDKLALAPVGAKAKHPTSDKIYTKINNDLAGLWTDEYGNTFETEDLMAGTAPIGEDNFETMPESKVDVPKTAPAVHAGPLPSGTVVTTTKKGLGEVKLYVEEGNKFAVTFMDKPEAATKEFGSLSAACDHVWVVQQGYEDAADYKKKNGVNKVPSGGGWKFWGLKAAPVAVPAATASPAPATEPVASAPVPVPEAPAVPKLASVWSETGLNQLPPGTVIAAATAGIPTDKQAFIYTKQLDGGWMSGKGVPYSANALALTPGLPDGEQYVITGAVTPATPVTPVPETKPVPGLITSSVELDMQPIGTVIEHATSGLKYKKANAAEWESDYGTLKPTSVLSFQTWKVVKPPAWQPTGQPSPWVGMKTPSLAQLASLPVYSTLVDEQGIQAVKNADGLWAYGKSGLLLADEALISDNDAYSIVGLGAAPWTPPAPAVVQPAPVAVPSANAPAKPVKVVDELESVPSLTQPFVKAAWKNAGQWLTTEAGPPGSGKNAAMKSPHWASWVPPPGLVVEGTIDGKKVWLVTGVSGYTKSTPTESGEPASLVNFAMWDEKGQIGLGTKSTSAESALAAAANKLGFPADQLGANELLAAFNLTDAAFPADSVFQKETPPSASSVISQPLDEMPAEKKEQLVSAPMGFDDFLGLPETAAKYGGTFKTYKSKQIKDGGAYYVDLKPTSPLQTHADSVAKLKQLIDDAGIGAHVHKGPFPSQFNNGAYLLVKPEALQKQVGAVTSVQEASSVAPTAPTPKWPDDQISLPGVSGEAIFTHPNTNLAALLATAPEGTQIAMVDIGSTTPTNFIKVANHWTLVLNGKLIPTATTSADMLINNSPAGKFTVYDSGGVQLGEFVSKGASGPSGPSGPSGTAFSAGQIIKGDVDTLNAMPVGSKIIAPNAKGTDWAAKYTLVKVTPETWKVVASGMSPKTDKVANKSTTGEFEVVTIGNGAFGAGYVPPKKLFKTWSEGDIIIAIAEAPIGAKVVTATGAMFEKTADGWLLEGAADPTATLNDYSLAWQVKSKGGASVALPGQAATAPTKKAKKVVAPKPKTPEQLAKEAAAKAAAEAKAAKAKAFIAWKGAHPQPASGTELFSALSWALNGSAVESPFAGSKLWAHLDGDHILIGAPDFGQIKAGADNWTGFPPFTVTDTPLGQALRIQKDAFQKLFPQATKITGPDGKQYPYGTQFAEKQVPAGTKQQEVTKLDGFYKIAHQMVDALSGTHVPLKFKPATDAKKAEVVAELTKLGVKFQTPIVGSSNVIVQVDKADLATPLGFKVEVEAKIPPQASDFVQAPIPFSLGTGKQGEPASENKADFATLDAMTFTNWGHTIRCGDPGVLWNSELRMKKVVRDDGSEVLEVMGTLTEFSGAKSKLTSGVFAFKTAVDPVNNNKDYVKDGKSYGLNNDKPFKGFTGVTDTGVNIQVAQSSKGDEMSVRNTFLVRIPVGSDYETELKKALALAVGDDKADKALAQHDADLERKFIKAQIVRSTLGPNGYWDKDAFGEALKRSSYGDEEWLDKQLDQLGKPKSLVDSAKIVVGCGGAHEVIVTGDWTEQDKKKPKFLYTSCEMAWVYEHLARGEGMPSRTNAYFNGTTKQSGASPSADDNSGGSYGLMTRIEMDEDKPGGDVVVYHPRVLMRTDFAYHNADAYGKTTASYTKHGSSEAFQKPSTTDHRKRMLSTGGGGEATFQNGIAMKDIMCVHCYSEASRQMHIENMKKKYPETTHINGVSIEDFFVYSTSFADFKNKVPATSQEW